MSFRFESRDDNLYNLVTGDEDARVCKDIPESACDDQPRNFFAYLLANLGNKIADELSSAKLILPWMMTSLGAPVALTGYLVPLRETGVLLPQMFVAAAVRRLPLRKPVWLLGGLLSALSLLGMLLVVLTLDGTAAGIGILAMLALFSLARGLCSVSAKDVLGKTVSKSRRGVLMGWSASLGGVVVLMAGATLALIDPESADISLFAWLLGIAVFTWVLALLAFQAIVEQPGATEGGGNAISVALAGFGCLRRDAQFRRFLIVRILLLGVALALPFYVLLAQQWLGPGIGSLGLLIVASGIASSISSPFWGKWGDLSSRRVMISAATGAALLGFTLVTLSWLQSPVLGSAWTHALVYIVLVVMHSGVRLGRKIYLVDMATAENRSMYVAVSNTVIGVAMLLLGSIGLLSGLIGLEGLILVLSLVSLAAAIATIRLSEA